MAATDPISNPPEIPDWVLREYEYLTHPLPGVPIPARSATPQLHSLQRWQQEAVRLGFDPEAVQLVYDGECFGMRRWRRFANQVPEELVDATLDPFWPG